MSVCTEHHIGMRVLKGGSEPCWLEDEVEKGKWPVLAVFALVVFSTAILVAFYWSYPTWTPLHFVPLVLVVAAWTFAHSRSYLNKEKKFFSKLSGRQLELRIVEDLRNLSDEYVLVTNWSPGMGDIDAVLFGPHGALVIEAKYRSERQVVRRGRWYYEKDGATRRARRNPLHQAEQGNKKVRERLQSLGFKCYVRSVVVLAKTTPFESDTHNGKVVSRPDLLAHIQSLDKGTKHPADELAQALLTGKRSAA